MFVETLPVTTCVIRNILLSFYTHICHGIMKVDQQVDRLTQPRDQALTVKNKTHVITKVSCTQNQFDDDISGMYMPSSHI
jgi:hypothetical protein